MKITIHLIDGNRLVSGSDEPLLPAQVRQLEQTIGAWNEDESTIRTLLFPCEVEVIDLRTPQKEQIELAVKQETAKLVNEVVQAFINGIKQASS